MRIFTLDNTFGYNPGHAGLTYSLRDRLSLVRRFDALGIDYVEAGRPAGAGNIQKFFDHARTECGLGHTRLVATARLDDVRDVAERDDELRAVIDSGAPAVALSACCWHAGTAGYAGYCRKIEEAVRFLKAHALEVIFRDEDFFQCYCGDPIFALRTLEAAKSAGADVLCLRDSTGAGLPQLVREAAIEVRKRFEGMLGICAHDDADLALATHWKPSSRASRTWKAPWTLMDRAGAWPTCARSFPAWSTGWGTRPLAYTSWKKWLRWRDRLAKRAAPLLAAACAWAWPR